MESTSYKYIHLIATTYQVRKIKKLITRNVDGVQETVQQQSGLIPPPHHHLLAELLLVNFLQKLYIIIILYTASCKNHL
jgi:hypothetical protein